MKDLGAAFRTMVSLLLMAALTLFTIQNMAPVEITFLNQTVQSRRFVVVGISFLVGLCVGILFTWRRRR